MDDPRRHLLLELFAAGLRRVAGRTAVSAALASGAQRAGAPPRYALLAIGKAAVAMALGARDALGERIERALIITKDEHSDARIDDWQGVEVLESAHPVPDERSLRAGARLLAWVDALPGTLRPLVLISGGASSLVEVLRPGVTLEQLQDCNREALAAGLPIDAINARRAQLSLLKGGGLTRRLAGREGLVLLISDVPGDDVAVIGSGLAAMLPSGAPSPDRPDRLERRVIASVTQALEAIAARARELGLTVTVQPERFDALATDLGVRFAQRLAHCATDVWVAGGESLVRLPQAPGRGGRNQHLALAAAVALTGQPDLLLLAAGTDGTDGPTADAGALVDAGTCERIALGGLNPQDALARADAGSALEASGDLLHTGPTGTNVGDLVIGLRMPLARAAEFARHERAFRAAGA